MDLALQLSTQRKRRRQVVAIFAAQARKPRKVYAADLPDQKRRRYQRFPQTFNEDDGRPTDSWEKWQAHLTEGEFKRLYKLGKEKFREVHGRVSKHLQRNKARQIAASGSAIPTELFFAAGVHTAPPPMAMPSTSRVPCTSPTLTHMVAGLRWLSGARDAEAFKYGMCRNTWYKNKTAVIKALCREYHKEMFNFEERLNDKNFLLGIEGRFAARTGYHLRGCVGALDGLLVYIKKPSKNETNKARSYYSRKSGDGLQCLAICDPQRRIHWLNMRTVGSAYDLTAYYHSNLHDAIHNQDLLPR